MKTYDLAATLPLLLTLLIAPVSAAPLLDATAVKKIDDTVNKAVADHVTPSCCIVIGTRDKVLFARAYGHLTYDTGSPVTTLDTIYDMASCSKPIGTATMTALLIQDGKLHIDDPVSKYLPSWNRDDKRTITIRNLATHTSGLPSYTSATRTEAERKPDQSHSDALIEHIAALPLQYKTNEGQLYACLNFLTLARVNEEAAGTSQERFLRERVFEPLGMINSGYYLRSAKKQLCAPTIGGKNFRQGVVHDPLAYYYRDGYHCPGNAGLFTTANDLTKFCQMILADGKCGDQQILAPQTVDLFFTNQAPASSKETWGLGWGLPTGMPFATKLNSDPKHACISHSGYTGTYVIIDRLAGAFMIQLTNRVYPNDSTNSYVITRPVRRLMIETDPVYTSAIAAKK